ncbi:MAG: hypothetical protein H6707_14700 [Deltaproteobacteria bacterium]|nr:hypothetical protein [Deltaproteobacteria bacterium]
MTTRRARIHPLANRLLAVAALLSACTAAPNTLGLRDTGAADTAVIDQSAVADAATVSRDADQDATADAFRPSAPVTVIDLGAVATAATVVVDIPANAIGFHLTAEVAPDAVVAFSSVRSPQGDALVDQGKLVGPAFDFPMIGLHTLSLAVPMTAASQAWALAGKWSVVLEAYDAQQQPLSTVQLRAYVQTSSDGAFHGGTLDLRLHIPPGLQLQNPGAKHAVTLQSALRDPAIIARLDAFFAGLRTLYQIDRGAVTAHGLDARYATIGNIEQVAAALAATAATPARPALDVVLVNDLRVGGNVVWGIAGSIPGTASFSAGNNKAGVVLNLSASNNPLGDGLTLVHEMGHFVGLMHTSELSVVQHDLLSDTPACGPPTLPAQCGDANNIMFPIFFGMTAGKGIVTSPQQRRVMAAAPIYRGPSSVATTGALTQTHSDAPAWAAPTATTQALVARMLAIGLCGHQPALPVQSFANHRAALRHAVEDPTIWPILRQRARATLRALVPRAGASANSSSW